jgi:hypothetical protein
MTKAVFFKITFMGSKSTNKNREIEFVTKNILQPFSDLVKENKVIISEKCFVNPRAMSCFGVF